MHFPGLYRTWKLYPKKSRTFQEHGNPGSYGCSVTNRTRFYFSRISISSYQSHMNVKCYVTLRCFYVTYRNIRAVRTYVTLRIETYGSTSRYGFLRYVRVENTHNSDLPRLHDTWIPSYKIEVLTNLAKWNSLIFPGFPDSPITINHNHNEVFV